MNYEEMLNQILDSNHYMTLATVDADGNPWASPLTYVFDGEKYLYFISSNHSAHILNIAKNSRVSFAIFDSLQTVGNAFGVQGYGVVDRILPTDIPTLLKGELLSLVSIVVLNRDYSFFRITLDEVYLPHVERWKEESPLRYKVL